MLTHEVTAKLKMYGRYSLAWYEALYRIKADEAAREAAKSGSGQTYNMRKR